MNKLQSILHIKLQIITSHQQVKLKTILKHLAPKLNLKRIVINQLRDAECETLLKYCEFMQDFGWLEGLNIDTEYVSNTSGPWWIGNTAVLNESKVVPRRTKFNIFLK